MIAVPYFEKALYELSEDELTAERLLALADEVEVRVQVRRGPPGRASLCIAPSTRCLYLCGRADCPKKSV